MISPILFTNSVYNREQSKDRSALLFKANKNRFIQQIENKSAKSITNLLFSPATNLAIYRRKFYNYIDQIKTQYQNLINPKKAIPDTSYLNIDKNSKEFIEYVYKQTPVNYNRILNINTESGHLLNIVESNKPYIYMVNHTITQHLDANAIKLFNKCLYREYLINSTGDKCPRSKVMANRLILPKTNGDKFVWMGVVPADVSIRRKIKQNNNHNTINQLAKEISEGKTSLYIFPEGLLSALFFLPTKRKFQPGTSVIIKKILEKTDEINVVPLGLAHKRKETAIHIGNPITFSKKNEEYFSSKGNKDSKFFNKKLTKLWKDNKENYLITTNGQAVKSDEIVPYISGILSENLSCCVKEAQQDLKKKGEILHLR